MWRLEYGALDICACVRHAARVAISPDFCWLLKGRKKNLRDVEAGPDWRVEDLLADVRARIAQPTTQPAEPTTEPTRAPADKPAK